MCHELPTDYCKLRAGPLPIAEILGTQKIDFYLLKTFVWVPKAPSKERKKLKIANEHPSLKTPYFSLLPNLKNTLLAFSVSSNGTGRGRSILPCHSNVVP